MIDHDDPFDALLAEALSPPARVPDTGFTARIGTAITEAERSAPGAAARCAGSGARR